PIGREIGLVDETRWEAFSARNSAIERGVDLLRATRNANGSAFDHLRRSDVTWNELIERFPAVAAICEEVRPHLDIRAKYEGYIARQDRQIERSAQWEAKLIPPGIDYATIKGLRNEARQKLVTFTPRSLGQALRISGITPADVTLSAVHLQRGDGGPLRWRTARA